LSFEITVIFRKCTLYLLKCQLDYWVRDTGIMEYWNGGIME
jgi:hypothetical protein